MVFASTRRIHFQWSGATLKRVRRTIQVRIFRGETKYVAECLDLPIVTEGDTLDEVTANIRESIGLHLEEKTSRNWAWRLSRRSSPPSNSMPSPDAEGPNRR
jgi:predicted RNase H-like HicB family nuclease